MLKKWTKTQLSIVILSLAIVSVFWMEIIGGMLHLYALTGAPHGQQMLGEYYYGRAIDAADTSSFYFQQALAEYKTSFTNSPDKKHDLTAYFIGNQYECGKGMPSNLHKAKYWYQQALQHGNPNAKTLINRINSILRTTSKPNKSAATTVEVENKQ